MSISALTVHSWWKAQGVCHRELNLESALLHRRDARCALQVKVAEFGLSRVRFLSTSQRCQHTDHAH